MPSSKRFQVLEAIVGVLANQITPRPPMIRVGFVNYQSVHAHPAVFVTIGPGSTTRRLSHQSWEHVFVVRIAWLSKGSESEPLEGRALQIHDQLLTAFDSDKSLGGLVRDIAMTDTLGTDEGELALAGSPIGPFWQDWQVRMVQGAQPQIG